MSKITFFTRDSIDESCASTIRLQHIVAGFAANGYQTRIVSGYAPTRLGKLKQFLYLYWLSLFIRSDAFIYGELVLPRFLGCFLFARRLFAERTEFPFYKITSLRRHKRLLSQCYVHTLRHVDQFITCSYTLKQFYEPHVKRGSVQVIPFFIDESFFDKNTNLVDQHQLCYCGYMGNNKDGIEDLLHAFSLFVEKMGGSESYRLVLLGSAEDAAMKRLNALVQQLGIEQHVVFKGRVPHEKVLETINASGLLVLTRPDNLQAQGGFPSKLGEYLSTGNPVLCTDVGEIKRVIGDDIIHFVPPGQPEEAAIMMVNVFSCYAESQQRAEKGQAFVRQFVPRRMIAELLSQAK
ncbi:glycosyltransferase [Vibrio fluvialis]|uniref:glycosyltransferase n=1 Tax=Vibrio fluvialis TaxID=676 RepID=UPI001558FB92|nr:glycosyltransferase [Vibrio fluvialis]MBY7766818.1 glycosyltransferase [Vibrio fluvialis]MBY7775470.1 glycosyltransferase [Vibrio fluvialis]MBY7779779.1 glycosyltransferase [Vibrio fluvialis]MBY7843680.1 glycosyltransferase [Vibrio fluvialis]MBY7919525.1 glycosyltransferase [Vibrio fluvialis]